MTKHEIFFFAGSKIADAGIPVKIWSEQTGDFITFVNDDAKALNWEYLHESGWFAFNYDGAIRLYPKGSWIDVGEKSGETVRRFLPEFGRGIWCNEPQEGVILECEPDWSILDIANSLLNGDKELKALADNSNKRVRALA